MSAPLWLFLTRGEQLSQASAHQTAPCFQCALAGGWFAGSILRHGCQQPPGTWDTIELQRHKAETEPAFCIASATSSAQRVPANYSLEALLSPRGLNDLTLEAIASPGPRCSPTTKYAEPQGEAGAVWHDMAK